MFYRVILKIGYQESAYDFIDPEEALNFAATALEHQIAYDDHDRPTKIRMELQRIQDQADNEKED